MKKTFILISLFTSIVFSATSDTTIDSAVLKRIYLGNYSYNTVLASAPILSLRWASDVNRPVFKNRYNVPYKMLADASTTINTPSTRVFFADTAGRASSSANFTYNGTLLNITGNFTASGTVAGGDLNITDSIKCATLNTGNGNNELYPMNQAVRSTDSINALVNAASRVRTDSAYLKQIQLDTTTTALNVKGRIKWDSDNRCISVALGNNVVYQAGQEMYHYARNGTGSTVYNGQCVYVSGATGSRQTVALANANSSAHSMAVIGLATEDIANGDLGYITTSGLVNDLNTNSWNEGDILYLSTTNGTLTNVMPAKGNRPVIVGVVVRKHLTLGSICVCVDKFQFLSELGDVDTTGKANGKVLGYSTVSGTWKPVDSLNTTVLSSTRFRSTDGNFVYDGRLNLNSLGASKHYSNSPLWINSYDKTKGVALWYSDSLDGAIIQAQQYGVTYKNILLSPFDTRGYVGVHIGVPQYPLHVAGDIMTSTKVLSDTIRSVSGNNRLILKDDNYIDLNSNQTNVNGNLDIGGAVAGIHSVGSLDSNAGYFLGNSTTDHSFGVKIRAGTSASDQSFGVYSLGNIPRFTVRGDGLGVFWNGLSAQHIYTDTVTSLSPIYFGASQVSASGNMAITGRATATTFSATDSTISKYGYFTDRVEVGNKAQYHMFGFLPRQNGSKYEMAITTPIGVAMTIDSACNENLLTLQNDQVKVNGKPVLTQDSNAVTITWGGYASTQTSTLRYSVVGSHVIFDVAGVIATSNSTSLTITNLPTAVRPTYDVAVAIVTMVTNNGVDQGVNELMGYITPAGVMTIYRSDNASWSANNSKGIQVRFAVAYLK